MKMYLVSFKNSGLTTLFNLLIVSVLFTTHLGAQESFEQSCSNSNNSFFLGCIPGWISTSGTPDTRPSGISAFDGAKFAHGTVNHTLCQGGGNLVDDGEGIALQFAFQQGVQYRLTYAYRESDVVIQNDWILTNYAINMSGEQCSEGSEVPAIHPGDQVVHSPASSNNAWTVNQVVFTPGANYNFLWFRASNFNPANPFDDHISDWYLDAVNIEVICENPVPSFQLVNAQGNPQTTFCVGDDIFINASASQNETSYFCSITKRAIGGGPALDYSLLVGNLPGNWQSGEAGIINIGTVWANYSQAGGVFEPGYEYQIQFAVSNPCSSWEVVYATFQVECCEQTAYFDPNDTGCGIDVVAATDYGPGTSHSWFLLSSTVANTAPFTLEHVSTSPEFEYALLQPGLYYTLIHKVVVTGCGEYCYAAYYRRGANCAVLQSQSPGAIDCEQANSICPAPGNTIGQCKPVFPGPIEVLSWDASFGATGYIVQINFNDDACCRSKFPESTFTYNVTGTELDLGTILLPPWECLNWRVRAVCNSQVLAWTEWNCFSGCPEMSPQLDIRSDNSSENVLTETATIAPNPATAQVSVQFDTPFTGTISLTDALGRKVDEKVVDGSAQIVFDVQNLPAGVYRISTQNAAQRKVYQLVKQ